MASDGCPAMAASKKRQRVQGAQASNYADLPPSKKAKNADAPLSLPYRAPVTAAQTTITAVSQSVEWAAWVASYLAECSQSTAEHHVTLDLSLQDIRTTYQPCCAEAPGAQVEKADAAAAATPTAATAPGDDAGVSTLDAKDDLAFLESIWMKDMPPADAQVLRSQGGAGSTSPAEQPGLATSSGSDSSNASTTGSFFIKSNNKHQLAQLEQQLGVRFDDAMYDEEEVHFSQHRAAKWWEYLYNQQQVSDAKLRARSALAASAKARSAVGSKLKGGMRQATGPAASGGKSNAHKGGVSFSEELENVRVYDRYGKVTEYEDAALKKLLDEVF